MIYLLDSLFIAILFIGFILTVLSIERKSMIYTALSMLVWIIIFASSHYIQVPGISDYSDFTINAISIAFVIVDIIWLIYCYTDYEGKYRSP